MTTYLITNQVTWLGVSTLGAGDALVVTPGGALVMPGNDFAVVAAGGASSISFAGYVYLNRVTVDRDVTFGITASGQFLSDTAGAGFQIGGTDAAPTGQARLDTQGSITVAHGTGVETLGGGNLVVNGGSISADVGVFLASDLDHLTNSGQIFGAAHAVRMQGSHLSLTNLGMLSAQTGSAVLVEGQSANISNSGTISGNAGAITISASAGFRLGNSGTILGDVTSTAAAQDEVVNSGTITGRVSLGAGDDSYAGGHLTGTLDMGLGNDTVDARGGAVSGLITDLGGHDTYLVDSAQTRITDTGAGVDQVLAWTSFALASGLENLTLIGAGDLTGAGNNLANRIIGAAGDNRLSGGTGADVLAGLAGADTLRGGLGADRLDGGEGDDLLRGDWGADRLTGGTGCDNFVFASLDHSPDFAGSDLITDFTPGEDHIDLSAIDAVHGNALSGDTFTFIGSADFSAAGQVHVAQSGGMTLVEAEVTGDGQADLVIRLAGLIALTAGDFLL